MLKEIEIEIKGLVKPFCVRCNNDLKDDDETFQLDDEVCCKSCYFDECDRVEIFKGGLNDY
jgi:hypothetical protein